MRKLLKYTLVLPVFLAACGSQAQDNSGHNSEPASMVKLNTSWPVVMHNYLSVPDADGLISINYKALAASETDRAVLKGYIRYLENQNPDAMSPDAAVSYWANLYNAVTVDVIVDNYPVKSIKEIKSGILSPGPWKLKLVTVNGKELSLDDIEHGIMRKQFPSPHVHYMVNCASIGCPNIKAGEWKAETLDADREMAARAFINSPRGVTVKGNRLTVSSIYSWFDEDFGGSKSTVLSHIREFADADLAAAIDNGATIKNYDYDWSLNGFE